MSESTDSDILQHVGNSLEKLSNLQVKHENIFNSIDTLNVNEGEIALRKCEVKKVLDELDLNVSEARVIFLIDQWSRTLTLDHENCQVELIKFKNENDILRDRLEEMETKLEETLVLIAGLEIERDQFLFMKEV